MNYDTQKSKLLNTLEQATLNFREAHPYSLLEDGSLDLFAPIHNATEKEMADQLVANGHTADELTKLSVDCKDVDLVYLNDILKFMEV